MHFDHELKSIHVHVSTSVGSTTVISLGQATSMAGEESVKQCTDEVSTPSSDDIDDIREHEHFLRVIEAFKGYRWYIYAK